MGEKKGKRKKRKVKKRKRREHHNSKLCLIQYLHSISIASGLQHTAKDSLYQYYGAAHTRTTEHPNSDATNS
jgi:hypothetical protein